MKIGVSITTLWKTYNIAHGPWNCILSTEKVLQRTNWYNVSQNVIQRRNSTGNQRTEGKHKIIILIMDANEDMNKLKL